MEIEIIPTKDNNDLKFDTLSAFICNGSYFLTTLRIFENGNVDCWGIVSFDEFVQKVEEGWVTVELPDADIYEICIDGLGDIVAGYEFQNYKTNADLIAEVKDIIAELNGLPNSLQRCKMAWFSYQSCPIDEKRELLREAYEAVPRNNRMYILGDQDRKDYPIRAVLAEHDQYLKEQFDPYNNGGY